MSVLCKQELDWEKHQNLLRDNENNFVAEHLHVFVAHLSSYNILHRDYHLINVYTELVPKLSATASVAQW